MNEVKWTKWSGHGMKRHEMERNHINVWVQGFEMIKSLYLDPEQFSIDNGLMTPTFKLKRPPLQAKYKPQIDAMYKKINSGK